MQQILKQAIEQMVRLGNELNWNPPIDHEYVNALNELRALRDATQHRLAADGEKIPPQTLICGWCGNHRIGYVKDGVGCSCGGNSWMVCTLGCLEHEQPAAAKA